MPSQSVRGSLRRGLAVFATPGMYLVHKYTQYKRTHQESQRKKATEKELHCLHLKIDKLLSDLDENDAAIPWSEEEECVVCLSAKATMQTFPCGHMVVCRKCFVKTIQVAVSQRCLPLLCVVCRTKIFRLKQSGTSPPLTPPPSRPHFQLPWQFNRSRSPPERRNGRSSSHRPSSFARHLFGNSGTRVESIPSNINNNKTQTSASKTGASQAKPVATKLMKPLLIYPSEKNVETQQQGFCSVPSALKNGQAMGDNKNHSNIKKHVRFASPIRSHSTPVKLMYPLPEDMQSSPKCERVHIAETGLSSIKYADCFSPCPARIQLSDSQNTECISENFICPPYKTIGKGITCAK